MRVVLDASAAVGAVLGTGPGKAILDLLSSAAVVIAPELYVPEVANSLWKYVAARQLSIADAGELLADALKLIDRYHPEHELAQEMLREAAARNHPAYDLAYAVLARREGAAVVTLDGRLKRVARAMDLTVFP